MIATAIHTVEVWLVALMVTVALLGGFGIFTRWSAHSPAVRRARLDDLRVGMTPEEVVSILGEPRKRRVNAEGVRQWVYGSIMKRHVLLLQFNAAGHVESFAHGVPNPKRAGPPPPLKNV